MQWVDCISLQESVSLDASIWKGEQASVAGIRKGRDNSSSSPIYVDGPRMLNCTGMDHHSSSVTQHRPSLPGDLPGSVANTRSATPDPGAAVLRAGENLPSGGVLTSRKDELPTSNSERRARVV